MGTVASYRGLSLACASLCHQTTGPPLSDYYVGLGGPHPDQEELTLVLVDGPYLAMRRLILSQEADLDSS